MAAPIRFHPEQVPDGYKVIGRGRDGRVLAVPVDAVAAAADTPDATPPEPTAEPSVIGQIGKDTFVIDVDGTHAALVENGQPRRPAIRDRLMKRVGGYVEDVTDEDGAKAAVEAWNANPLPVPPPERRLRRRTTGVVRDSENDGGGTPTDTSENEGSAEAPKSVFIDDERNAGWIGEVRRMREEAKEKGLPDPVEERRKQSEGDAPRGQRKVINLDEDPVNANWIRIARQEREKTEAAADSDDTPGDDKDAKTAAVDDDDVALFDNPAP